MKKMVHGVRSFVASCILLSPLCAMCAPYDETTGYVTLTKGESSWGTWENTHSYSLAGFWSDGLKPHPETNYYAGTCLGLEEGKFKGNTLVLGNSMHRIYGYDMTIEDLQLLNGAYFDSCLLGRKAISFSGRMTILATSANPFRIDCGYTGERYDINMTLVGSDTAAIKVSGRSGQVPGEEASGVDFLGDTSDFYGRLTVDFNVTGRVGNWGLPNASAFVVADTARFGANAANGRTVPVKSLSLTAGKLLLGGTNCLSVGTMDVADGTVFDCSALEGVNASVDAALIVGEGWTQRGKIVFDVSNLATGFGENPVDLLVVSNEAGTVDTDLIEVAPARLVFPVEWVRTADVTALRIRRLLPSVYDATTGYVVLTNSEDSSARAKDSYSEAGWWSDGDMPHSSTNYYTGKNCLQLKASKFEGAVLAADGDYMRVDSVSRFTEEAPQNVCTINDFRILGNGCTFNQCGDGGRRVFSGEKWYILTGPGKSLNLEQTTYTGPDESTYSRYGESIYIFRANFYGDATATIWGGNPASMFNHAYSPGSDAPEVHLLGDMSHYLGSYRMKLNAVLKLGNTGLPGAIYVDELSTHLTVLATNNATVSVGSYTAAKAATVEVPATNTLAFGSVNVTGALTKIGAGALAIGGAAVAGTDASIIVTAGGLKPLSQTCVSGIPVSFAAGTQVVLDWTPDDADVAAYGLDLSGTMFLLGGSTLKVRFDVDGRTLEKTSYRKNLITVKTADAVALAGRIQVIRPRGFRVAKVDSQTEGDLTIFYADIEPSGMLMVVH